MGTCSLRDLEGFLEEVKCGCISANLAFHLELFPLKHILYRAHFYLIDITAPYYKVKKKNTPLIYPLCNLPFPTQ